MLVSMRTILGDLHPAHRIPKWLVSPFVVVTAFVMVFLVMAHAGPLQQMPFFYNPFTRSARDSPGVITFPAPKITACLYPKWHRLGLFGQYLDLHH